LIYVFAILVFTFSCATAVVPTSRKMRHLVVVLLCLVCIENAVGLRCYATDIKAMQSGHLVTNVEECSSNIRNVMEMNSLPNRVSGIPNYRCYKVVATEGDMTSAVKGCIPEGGCGILKSLFNELLKSTRTECYECMDDKCNSAQGLSVFGVVVGALAGLVLLL
jgi:hypothetical protein